MLTGPRKLLVAGQTLPMTLVVRLAGEMPIEDGVERPRTK
jgi:hypothetical protein